MSTKVHTDFTSNDQQLMRTLERQQKEIERLTNECRKLRDESKRGAAEGQSGMMGWLTSTVTVTGAVTLAWETAKRNAEDYFRTVKEGAADQADFGQKITTALRQAGDLRHAPEISKRLENIRGMTLAQGEAVFGGLSESGPNLSRERRLELTEAAAPLARTGAKPEELRQFSQVMGELADMAPGKTADDLADLGQGLNQLTRGDFSKLGGPKTLAAIGKLQQAGVGLEDSLGMMAAALDANQPASVVGQLASLSIDDLKARHAIRGKPLSPADMAYNRAAALGPEERRKLLMSDRDVAAAVGGEDFALALGQISPDVARQRAQQLRDFQRQDLMRSLPDEMQHSIQGAMELLRQGGEAGAQKSPTLANQASAENIIAGIDKRLTLQGYGKDQRTAIAMRIRAATYAGEDASGAALANLGALPESSGRHPGWFGTARQMTPEEKANWTEMISLLRTIANQQQKGRVNPNGHVER